MEENLSKFITAILAIVIMFIFPVYIAYEKKDDISYALAVRYTQEFVDKVRSKGYVTNELYQDYVTRLLTTGNIYDIEMEHRYVRFDPSVSETSGEVKAVRNEEIYTNDYILDFMERNSEHKYVMNVNDSFNVKIKNKNVTMATIIYNIVTVNLSSNNVRIYVDYGGKILADKWWGNIDFFQGDKELDGGIQNAHVEVEAYKTLDDAKNINTDLNSSENEIVKEEESKITPLKDEEKIILLKDEQKIYYKVKCKGFGEGLGKVEGVVYNGASVKEELGKPIYEDEDQEYSIYEIEYKDVDVTTYLDFTAEYISKYGESIIKKAQSPKINIEFNAMELAAFASKDNAVKNVGKIETIKEDVDILFCRVTFENKPDSITVAVYDEENNLKQEVSSPESTDSNGKFVIYKITYPKESSNLRIEFTAKYNEKGITKKANLRIAKAD